MNLRTINKSLAEKLLGINIKTEEDLVKCNSVDIYIMLEKKHNDISLHMLWILEQAILEARRNLRLVNN